MNILGIRTIVATLIVVMYVSYGAINAEAESMIFCPADAEAEAREVLELGENKEISLNELLAYFTTKKISFEISRIDNIPRTCNGFKNIERSNAYMVFAGFDKTRRYTRNYLIIADEYGYVQYIERRNAYPDPEMFFKNEKLFAIIVMFLSFIGFLSYIYAKYREPL